MLGCDHGRASGPGSAEDGWSRLEILFGEDLIQSVFLDLEEDLHHLDIIDVANSISISGLSEAQQRV